LNHEKKLETSEDNIVGGAVNSDDATGTDNITEDATGGDSHDSVKPSSWLFRSVNE